MTRHSNIDSDDYYQVLGLPRSAADSEVIKAYRELARLHHPDKHQEDKIDSEEKFKRITEAYEALHDAEKRKVYDKFGKHGLQNGARLGEKKSRVSVEELDLLFGSSLPGSRLPEGCRKLYGGLGKDIDFQQVFCAVNAADGHRKRPRETTTSPFTIPRGRTVFVHGLSQAVEHNDKKAQVQGFDPSKGRYDIKLKDGPVLSVKPENITQYCGMKIHGLTAQPQLNGLSAKIVGYQHQTGNYAAMLRNGSAMIFISPRNCILDGSTCVRLRGLSEELDGKMARVLEVDVDAGQYSVQCSDGQEIRIKYENAVC